MSALTTASLKAIHLRDNESCARCGRRIMLGMPFSRHHRRARGMGGSKAWDTNLPGNVVLLCGSATTPGGCHLWVESNRERALARGWLVRQGEDPTTVPLGHALHGWVYLLNDGSVR